MEGVKRKKRSQRPSPGGDLVLHSASIADADNNSDRPLVEIDSSPVYELLLSLLVFGYGQDPAALECSSDWVATVRARAAADVLRAFDELAPRCWLWNSLLFVAWDMRAGRQAIDCSQFIERIRSMNAQRLIDSILGWRGRSGSITHAVVRQAVAGSPSARLKVGKALFPDEPAEDHALGRFLVIPPAHVKDLLLRIIEQWFREFFRQDERELASRLANEARTKRIIGRSAPTRLLQASAIGIHYLPRRAVKHVLLIPSVVCHPSIITIRSGVTRIFFYPLAEESTEEEDLPSQAVKMHRALADRERLRILQLLLRSEHTVDSLSNELRRPQEGIRAQLITLRDAGLVVLQMDERRTSFEIRPNLPSFIFRSLQALLPESVNRLPAVTA